MTSLLFSVFVLCITIQILYLIIFLRGFTSFRRQSTPNNEPVSVIIAARNELANLKKLLPKLYTQHYHQFEIIVINDQSSDGTYDFLKEETLNNSLLKVVTVDHVPDHVNSKKYALTLGIKAAHHDLLLLTDADCLPVSSYWITEMAGAARSKEFVLGFSGYMSKPGLLNYFIRFETILTAIQYISLALAGRPYMGVGRNLAYRKKGFLSNKGFNGFMNVPGGDDDLLVNRYATSTNTAVAIGKNANTISWPKESWSSFIRQKTRHLNTGRYYKVIDKVILGTFSLTYILSWLLLPVVLLTTNELYWVAGSFLTRALLLYLTFSLTIKKLNVTFNVWGLLFLDLLYAVYYSYTGVVSFLTKRVTWN